MRGLFALWLFGFGVGGRHDCSFNEVVESCEAV